VDADAAYFVSKAAKFEVVDGMFHISFDIGPKAHIEIVMAPHVFAECVGAASELLAKWRVEQLPVIRLPKRRH
jgi:hypothetical protein